LIFQDGGLHHLGFSNSGNFRGGKGQEGQNASPGQISSRPVKPLVIYGDFLIFRFFKMAVAAILDFKNQGSLGVGKARRVNMSNFASIRLTVAEIWRFFQAGGRPPSWICDEFLDHPRSAFSGLYHCAKLG